jgi:uncharacterized membrane protein
MDNIVLKTHILSCAFMTGLIWLIQLVHYPAFKYASQNDFLNFHTFHSQRISMIVMPVMVIELLTGALLFWQSTQPIIIINMILLLLIWLSTFFLSVPLHNKLAQGFCDKTSSQLVLTNWPRTIFWTLRSLLLSITFLF